MQVELFEQRVIPASPATVLALSIDAERFPSLFRGCGPIPAITSVTLHGLPAVGVTRDVVSSDGSRMREIITALVPGQRHAYTLSGIRPPLAWLVRAGHADWTFAQVADGTRVTWQYRFELSHALSWPLAAPLLHLFMRTAMRRCLAAIEQQLATAA